MSNTINAQVLDALRELLACNTESAGWSMSMVADRAAFVAMLDRSEKRLAAAKDAARAALAAAEAAQAQPAAVPAQGEPAEPLKGWKLNHVRRGDEDGTAEIGYLDPEDDIFRPIVTVDTGLYYQEKQALPLGVAILGLLEDAQRLAAQPVAAVPAREPLEGWRLARVIADAGAPELSAISGSAVLKLIRAVEAAYGIAAPAQGEQQAPQEQPR